MPDSVARVAIVSRVVQRNLKGLSLDPSTFVSESKQGLTAAGETGSGPRTWRNSDRSRTGRTAPERRRGVPQEIDQWSHTLKPALAQQDLSTGYRSLLTDRGSLGSSILMWGLALWILPVSGW